MKKAQRTDVHRPGAIIPSDYEMVLIEGWGMAAYIQGRQGEPPFGVRETATFLRSQVAEGRQVFGGIGKCGVCGAWFMEGIVLRHVPTGDYVHLGHTCADKYEMLAELDWDSATDMVRRARAAEITKRENERRAAEAWAKVDAVPGLREAFETKHDIIADIRARVERGWAPSEKQAALVLKIAREEKEKPVELRAVAPTGRVVVRGKIVSTRTIPSNDYRMGPSYKMVVKVTEKDGSIWLVWSTVPQSIFDSARELAGQNVTMEGLKGFEVEFTATLEPGKDAHFAFGKRPTKGRALTLPKEKQAA